MDRVNDKPAKKMALEIANKYVTKSIFFMDDDELKEQRIQARENAIKCVQIILNTVYGDIGSSPEKTYWLAVRDELIDLLKD